MNILILMLTVLGNYNLELNGVYVGKINAPVVDDIQNRTIKVSYQPDIIFKGDFE